MAHGVVCIFPAQVSDYHIDERRNGGQGMGIFRMYTGADGKGVELGYVWADVQGQVTVALDTTNLPAGEYRVVAHGNTSGVEARMNLNVVSK